VDVASKVVGPPSKRAIVTPVLPTTKSKVKVKIVPTAAAAAATAAATAAAVAAAAAAAAATAAAAVVATAAASAAYAAATTVFVRNIPMASTGRVVMDAFSKVGAIHGGLEGIAMLRKVGKVRNATVRYERASDAAAALKAVVTIGKSVMSVVKVKSQNKTKPYSLHPKP
jgi:hypothetical protein